MSEDLIKRSDAIGACAYETIECYEARKAIRNLPSVDIPQSDDWEKYSDRLWKLAYEKGKASVRPQGGNLLEKYPSLFECSVCGASCSDTIPWDCNINYCPNCGCRMKGADDYERAIEQMEHDMLYEPTYNPEKMRRSGKQGA